MKKLLLLSLIIWLSACAHQAQEPVSSPDTAESSETEKSRTYTVWP